MKIMLITTLYPGYVGQSRKEISYALHYFVKDWVESGYEVRVIKISPRYPKIFNFSGKNKIHSSVENFQLEGVNISRIDINKIPKIDYLNADINQSFEKINRIIKKEYMPDVIVSHMINPNIYIANKIKDEHNIPVILTLHQTDLKNLNNYPKRYKRFTKIINNIDKIGFRSDALKRQFDLLNISYSESFLAPSGIEENVLIKNILLEKKINSQAKNIFIAANMIPLKNIDILIKAFDEVAKKNKHIYLKIAGDGPEKNKLEKLVNQLKLNNRIEFLGFLTREEVLSHMESSDIFAMVSSPETFGLVYLEAMAKGCITIGSLGEGIEGVIQDGINGFLCEPKNIGKLAEKLTTALELDSRNKSDILHNAVDTASKMTGKQMSKNYLEVLKGL